MFSTLKNLFRPRTPRESAVRDLEQAERELYQARAVLEFAESTCTYNEVRIARLKAFINEATKAVPRA